MLTYHLGEKKLAALTTLTLALFIASATATAKTFETRRGFLWEPYLEWAVVKNEPLEGVNGFDLVAEAVFHHTRSGAIRKTQMFYRGENKWSFRFSADRVGEWNFVTTGKDKELSGHKGRVLIAPNPVGKPVGALTSIGAKWAWSETGPFVPQLAMWDYIAGDGNPKTFYQNPEMVDRLIEEFIIGHGFSGFHIPVISGRWFDLDRKDEKVEPRMTEPDGRTFEALELLITRTYRAGGMVHIWAWGDEYRRQTPHSLKGGGINGAIDRRLQRYIAARLGPLPGWSVGYGFDLDEWVKADQVRAWRDYISERMMYPHFLGGRPDGPNRGLDHKTDAEWNRGLDYSSYEHHQPDYPVYRAAMAAVPGVPVMSEDRFRIRKSPWPDKDYDLERLRRGLYHSTLAGGVANIWGIHPDFAPGGVFPNKEQIKTWSVFFHGKGRFLADMEPAEAWALDGKSHILWSPGAESMTVYREETDQVRIKVPETESLMSVVAVDTKGVYEEIDLGKLEAGERTIKLPQVSDWALAIGTFQTQGANPL